MATLADVRRIALSLPGAEAAPDGFSFSILVKQKPKGFAWVWKERVVPKKPRIPNPSVIAVRVANNTVKDMMMSAEPGKYVVDPHYDGYPAVLVRLSKVRVPELRTLLTDSHRTLAPRPKRA